MHRFFSLILMLLLSSTAYADVVSLDGNYVPGQTDMVTKLNNDRTALQDGINNIDGVFSGSAQSSGQIKADTIGEENMADDANPRIRTNEGASCADLVVSGLLPATTSGTLVGSIPAGVAYPDGYRIDKTSSTAKSFTANKWTYIDLDINGTFQYSEVTIDGSTPSVAANSARLARVSTDATEVTDVQDLRTTSCSSGPFSAIADTATGATLADLFSNGTPVKDGGNSGWLQGLAVSYDTHTTFLVKNGSAYINGEYRFVSTDVTVPQTADNPTQGTSGVDSSIASSTRYNVFAVADQDAVSGLSITYSSSASPAGVTNYRKIGEIATDASSLFTSFDVSSVNQVNQSEIVSAWVKFNGTASTIVPQGGRNITSITDNGVGDYSVTFGKDFANVNYASACTTNDTTGVGNCAVTAQAVGSLSLDTDDFGGTTRDYSGINLIVVGDQ